MSPIVYGSDPEFFAIDSEDGDKFNVIPPVIFRESGLHFEENGRHPIFKRYGDTIIHEDGAAFEMSTPPTESWEDMWNTINDAKSLFSKDVLSLYPSICLPHLFSIPTANWQVSRWKNKGEGFKLCTEFGCDADEDVYNMSAKKRVTDASKHPYRYAGGHIHISGIKDIEDRPLPTIRSLVLTAGLASTAFSDVPDLEKKRLFLYGKPGKFRIQYYPDGAAGVEYRTPSTRWTNNFDLARRVFTWVEIGIKYLLVKNLLPDIAEEVEESAKTAILECDQESAKSILSYIEGRL